MLHRSVIWLDKTYLSSKVLVELQWKNGVLTRRAKCSTHDTQMSIRFYWVELLYMCLMYRHIIRQLVLDFQCFAMSTMLLKMISSCPSQPFCLSLGTEERRRSGSSWAGTDVPKDQLQALVLVGWLNMLNWLVNCRLLGHLMGGLFLNFDEFWRCCQTTSR